MHCKIIIILYKECCAEMAYIFDKVDLEICYSDNIDDGKSQIYFTMPTSMV